MNSFLNKLSSWRLIISLIILSGIINLYFFPKYEIEYNNEKLIALDLRSSYNYEDVVDLFTKMDSEGRQTYQFSISVIDMIYPLIYGFLLILLLNKLIEQLFKKKSLYIFAIILPLLIVICDYTENINTLSMLTDSPDIKESSVFIGSKFSGFKWYLVSFTISSLIAGTIFLFLKNIVSKWKDKMEN